MLYYFKNQNFRKNKSKYIYIYYKNNFNLIHKIYIAYSHTT